MSKRKRTSFTLKCKAKEAPKLKKFRADVLSLSSKSGNDIYTTSDDHRNPIPWLKSGHTLTRKQNRKDARKLKKARRRAYRSGKPIPSMEDWQNSKIEATQMKEKTNSLKKLKAKKKKQRQKLKEKKNIKKEEKIDARKQMLLEEIAKEDKMLKQLEKNLHLNKRKSKSLPQSFVNDGLDYLLDVLDDPGDIDEESDLDGKTKGSDDSEKEDIDDDREEDELEEEEDGDEDLDEEDDIDEYEEDDLDEDEEDIEEGYEEPVENITIVSHKTNDTKSILTKTDKHVNNHKNQREKKRVSFDTCSDNGEHDNDAIKVKSKKMSKMLLNKVQDDDNDEINESDDLSDDKSDDANVIVEDVEEEFTEDIYGRLRDKSGNIVIKEEKSAKYIPPGKRLQISDEKKKFQVERLRKQLKGLVNRASEENMSPICSQIEAVYRGNSRAEVTESLAAIVIEACVSVTMTPERLAMEMMMLVAILHGNVGSEVGALFLQSLAQKYKSVRNHGNHMENKTLDNIIMLFAYLYVFKVIDSTLLFGIIDDLVKTFQEKDIQIVLLILKNVGFNLRKDNPNQLKDTIMNIQSAAKAVSHDQSSHVKYMLEIILAIKNNNMRKIPNYDPEHQEHLKKVTRGILRGTTLGTSTLRIGLNDLIEAEHRGRWWLVGSAWEGPTDEAKPGILSYLILLIMLEGPTDDSKPVEVESVVGDMSSKVLELARKQRMNTDVRRNIFCIIISSQDYVDAFEKLLRLSLKNQQEREIIHIIVDLCLQEKKYNPFYAYLLQKFCIYHRRFQMSVQFLMWDKFKEMKKLSQLQRQHLSKLLSHLLSTKAMSLSVLKVVEFGTLDVFMLRFLKQLMQSVLVDYSEDVMRTVFERIAPLSKLHLLHEGLKLFMQHFLLRKKSKDVTESPLLRDRISIAEKILTSSSKDTSL